MSDRSHPEEVISALPCEIEMPPEWADFFEARGALRTALNDLRRFPRFYLRSHAAMQIIPTFPALRRSTDGSRVYVKDVSRSSIA